MTSCLDSKYPDKIFNSGRYGNPFLNLLILYFIFSIAYYYFSLTLGETVLFGGQDFFFRSWRGRPVGQFLSFISYCVVPFYIIKKYAQFNSTRRIIERAIVIATIILLYYGFIQQVCYLLGLPVTGRDLYEGRVVTEKIEGIHLLRFYSLGGEPRDLGCFMIGAILFYMYFNYGEKNKSFSKINIINILLMIVAFLLTSSTTAFIVLFLSIIVLMLDFVYFKRTKYTIGLVLISIIIISILISSELILVVGARTIGYYEALSGYLKDPYSIPPEIIRVQSSSVSILMYFMTLPDQSLITWLFGYGYGNFSAGIYDILGTYFHWDIIEDGTLINAGFYFFRLFVECGILGILIYVMMFFYILKINNRMCRFYRRANNRIEYNKTLLLRYAFFVFFVSNAISISFYYYIIMGIIIGKFNSVINSNKRNSYRIVPDLMDTPKS